MAPHDQERHGAGRRNEDSCEIRCKRMEDIAEDVGKKPSWTGVNVYMSLVLLIVVGAFAYVTLTHAGLKDYVEKENNRQDAVIAKIFEKLDKIGEKQEDIRIIVSNHQAQSERGR